MAKPKTIAELADIVAAATAPFDLRGLGTKAKLGRVPSGGALDLSAFAGIIKYEPEELVLEVGSATRLADVEKLLTKNNQMLAFEPPDFSGLLGAKNSGTIGGVLACNLSGPRRMKAGAVRDHVLGLSAVSGRGEIFKTGAHVVKNVTGYDLPKLMAGSYGTLAAFASVIFKVMPKPETQTTVLLHCGSDVEALALMTTAMQSPHEVSGAAYVPGQGVMLRVEGIAPSVDFRTKALAKMLDTKSEIISQKGSTKIWQDLRDVKAFTDNQTRHIWKISIPPQDAPEVIARLKTQLEFRYTFDWAGGLIWLDHEPKASGPIIRGALKSGHAMLFRGDDEARNNEAVFSPQPPPLAALTERVKRAFDPKGLFNPGRMVKGH
jgi:glycolate oxidase FAD binding subunit